MINDIKNYIGQKIGIKCESEKEYHAILDLCSFTTIIQYRKNYKDVISITLFRNLKTDLEIGNENRFKDSHIIYPASWFLLPEWEIGEWYTSTMWGKGYYAKLDFIEHNRFHCSDTISFYQYKNKKSSWDMKGIFRKVPLSEIEHLLPKVSLEDNDEFVLPTQWYIEVTDENRDIINTWKKKQLFTTNLFKNLSIKFVMYNGCGFNDKFNPLNYKNYKPITLDQFKKYVLKELPEVDYTINTSVPQLNLTLPKNTPKQIKPIKLEQFSITITKI